jgi:hypothetical protein
MTPTSVDMDERKLMLTNYALVVKEEGLLGLRSCEELKDIIFHHINICKHEFYTYRSHVRNLIFATSRIINGYVEL